MTSKKFFETSQFKTVQKEWYAKLKESGFDDLEWFNPKTGFGQNSDYLKKTVFFDRRRLTKDRGSADFFRLFRHFLVESGFLRLKMPRKRLKLGKSADLNTKIAKTSSKKATAALPQATSDGFKPLSDKSSKQSKTATSAIDDETLHNDYIKRLQTYYKKLVTAEAALKYADGWVPKKISAHLRQHFTLSRLDLRWSERAQSELVCDRHLKRLIKLLEPSPKSYSTSWVYSTIEKLKAEAAKFNVLDSRGLIRLEMDEQDNKTTGEFMQDNDGVGL